MMLMHSPTGICSDFYVFKCARTLPADTPGQVDGFDFVQNDVEIGPTAFSGDPGNCPLAGILLHEAVHLTWGNLFSNTPEAQAYGVASGCFGDSCARPEGVTTLP